MQRILALPPAADLRHEVHSKRRGRRSILVGAAVTVISTSAKAMIARRICQACVTTYTDLMPCSRRMTALRWAFPQVSSDPRSTHCTGTWKSCTRLSAMIAAIGGSEGRSFPPVTRTGNPVRRYSSAPARTRSIDNGPRCTIGAWLKPRTVSPPRTTMACGG
jgi:hypothetical protein